MARRIQWISFLIVFLAISNCLATSSKNLKNNKSVKVNKKNSPSIAINSKRNNDFIFSDDEDRLSLMLGDQPIESSGDGSPDVDIVPETPENGSPEVDIAPETPENGSPDVAPETSENGSPDVAPETPENGNPDVVPENPEIGNPDVDPETPENIVVTSKPVVAITKKPHRPPVNASFPDNYIPTEVCGKKYHCRRGQRGPCHRNEIFSSDPLNLWSSVPAISQHSTCAANALHNYGCVSSKRYDVKKHSSKGYCSVRYAHKPCFGYPSSYRYCKRTKRCYPCQSSTIWNRRTMISLSPCRSDQTFTAIDGIFGHCRCKRRNYVQCKLDHKCYPAFSKGPCSKGQWLVPTGSSGYSSCRPCPCPSMADGSHVYWNGPIGRPGCYKSHTRGPCRPGMYFVVDNFTTGVSRCVYSHRNTKRHQRPNLYSLLMDWPLFESDSLLNDPFSSIDSQLPMRGSLDMEFGMGYGNDLFDDMLF